MFCCRVGEEDGEEEEEVDEEKSREDENEFNYFIMCIRKVQHKMKTIYFGSSRFIFFTYVFIIWNTLGWGGS